MCATKTEKPTLQGVRLKTRIRDKKVKYDAESFAEALISRINETDGSFEAVSSVLEKAGQTLDYMQYSEALLEILIAGGILAGGKVESDPIAIHCLFASQPTIEDIRPHMQILMNLQRRYRYLQTKIKDVVLKVINYLKSFTDTQRQCLAMYTALCITEGILSIDILNGLFAEHLVKDESISLAFTILLFKILISEKGIANVGSMLRKNQLEDKLLNILPPSRRTEDNFDKHFIEAGLLELVTFRKAQQNTRIKKKLRGEIDDYLEKDTDATSIIEHCQEVIEASTLSEVHVVVLIWNSIMGLPDWSKREDVLLDQLEHHLEKYCGLLEAFCEEGTPQLILLREIQEYCHNNTSFTKLFHKIVIHLYKKDILSEQAILKWNDGAYLPIGKDEFLKQMKKMVDWLLTAEEESDEDTPKVTDS